MSTVPNVTYKFNSYFHLIGFANFSIGVILLIIGSSIPVGIFTIKIFSITLIIIGIILLVLFGNKDVIKIFNSHIEIKTAPSATLQIVNFYQIKRVLVKTDSILIDLKDKRNAIKLPKKIFNKTDVTQIVVKLRSFIVNTV